MQTAQGGASYDSLATLNPLNDGRRRSPAGAREGVFRMCSGSMAILWQEFIPERHLNQADTLRTSLLTVPEFMCAWSFSSNI